MNDHPEGGVGYLEMWEYNRFVWAWEQADKIIAWLRSAGEIKGTQEDVRVSSSTDPATPLAATWLAADEINSHCVALNRFPTEQAATKDEIGQYHAVELGRLVASAERRWPRVDKPRRITFMTYGGRDKLTLTYRPPRYPGDEIVISCYCGYTLTPSEYALVQHIILSDVEEGHYADASTTSATHNQA